MGWARDYYSLSTFGGARMRKIPGSPHLHNFNVCILECGSLGTRLGTGLGECNYVFTLQSRSLEMRL